MNASLVGWIVTLVFIVILVAGFLIGFWRGLKHSTVNLVISVVGVIIAFFITPLITNAVLNIKVSYDGESIAMQALILKYITSIEGVGGLIEKNPNLEKFFLNLPSVIINVVLFMLVTIVLELLLYVVYKILAKTVFKLDPEKKKHRLSGGIVGVIKSLIVVVFAFMPFASLIGVANTVTSTGDYGINSTTQVMTVETEKVEEKSDDGIIAEVLPETALNVIDGMENNLLTKMCGIFGLDNALFDYYGSFDVEGEKLKVREEIVNVYNVVDLSNQLTKVDESYSFKDFNYEKISKTLKNLSSSPMFKNVLCDTLGEIIINYKDYSFIRDSKFAQENSEILDAISLGLEAYAESGGKISDYFTDDINKLIDVALSMGQSGAIDEIIALEKIDADGVVKVLAGDDNYETTKDNLDILFSMNIVRDGTAQIAKKLATQISSDIDEIGVSTENWTDSDWSNLSSSISSIAKKYLTISEKINILDVLGDATILLENEKYDIETILSELGSFIDEARAVNLLQTSEGKPIIDKLLSKNNLPLPDEEGVIAVVKENDGNDKTLRTHKELLEFIAPSLVGIRDNQIYSIVASEKTTNEKLISLASIVSEEGNETLLSDIFMPMYQVEPTKSLIISQFTDGLKSELIDLSALSSYDEWKADLDYISVMLKTLNGKTMNVESGGQIEEKTYLELALDDNLSLIIDNLEESDVEQIIKPIFYAKSTYGIRGEVLTKISEYLRSVVGDSSLSLSTTGVTFDEGNSEDQTQEVCDVLKKLLPLKNDYISAEEKLKNVDKEKLGATLTAMQNNAYRVEINSKEEEGIFKDSFISFMSKFKSEYSAEIQALEKDPTLEEKVGVSNFDEENYPKINFEALMALIQSLES